MIIIIALGTIGTLIIAAISVSRYFGVGNNDTEKIQNMGDVRESIEDMANSKGKRRVLQTFTANNYIKPDSDFVLRYLQKKDSKKPSVCRLFSVSRPIDIHFIEHTIRLRKEYGRDKMEIYVVGEKTPAPFSETFVNFTIFDDTTLMTYPSRTDTYGEDIEISPAPDNSHSSRGVLVDDKVYTEAVKEYIDSLKVRLSKGSPTNKLQKIKKEMWQNNNKKYARAVGIAVVSDMLGNDVLKKNCIYGGIVGSSASEAKDRKPNDVDVIIVFEEVNKEIVTNVKSIVEKTTKYFNHSDVKFKPTYKADPISNKVLKTNGREVFPVQILMNDLNSVKEWSPFISAHRGISSVDVSGNILDIVDDSFCVSDLISKNEAYSLPAMLEYIDNKQIPSNEWVEHASRVEYRREYVNIQNDEEMSKFASYCTYWAVKNAIHASDSEFNKSTANSLIRTVIDNMSDVASSSYIEDSLKKSYKGENILSEQDVDNIKIFIRELRSILQNTSR